jgi:putative two-component system response regulator
MHDVGKIGIPDNILMKPGKLTDEEFDFMKTHTTIGAKILVDSKAEILQLAQQIAISHHEKWNGRGYPQGLAGDTIPLAARIVGLTDVFDALTSKRPYKDPFPVEVALDIIKKERGEHFDPDVVDVFFENIDEILKIKDEVDADGDVSLPGV